MQPYKQINCCMDRLYSNKLIENKVKKMFKKIFDKDIIV